MFKALGKLAEEDPTFQVIVDESTGQTIISGMGELHIDILVNRLKREFKVQANVGQPRVSYKETITKPVKKVEHKYAKQSGGHGQYGHVVFEIEPMPEGTGVLFENRIKGGAIPTSFIPSVEKGVREAADGGVLAGYQITGVKVTLIDGSFHEVDSSDMAFKMAAVIAFKEGVEKAAPVLLEPIMKVEVLIPEEYLGDVIGQLNARRANITGMDVRQGNSKSVKGLLPLSEMFGYATELRSATQGRGIFTMEFDHYAPVSEAVAQKVLRQ